MSILDLERLSPTVDPVFNTGCVPACTVTTCSCTASFLVYWSATSNASSPDSAWAVVFNNGNTPRFEKQPNSLSVRAMRGGL